MEILQIKNLNFTYPKSEKPALEDISIDIKKGSFGLIFGASGCGKTTLLRLLKREIAPFGTKKGEILYSGISTDKLDDRTSASEIGFVGQNPDEQIVTDKVWHELAFGLENLGMETAVIRRRVGEMASYFGIQDWYHKNTDELSGGQKQLLNLASVMVMQPKILLLDEPTSQLDPIAAADFIATLQKLNRELGLTILLVEHRLEDVFSIADYVIAMENGKIMFSDEPRKICAEMKNHPLSLGMPSSARIWSGLPVPCDCPLTVKEGREFLEEHFSNKKGVTLPIRTENEKSPVIEAKELWFRYEKNLPDVLSGVSITIGQGEIYSVLGGNGTGKTTMLNVLSGLDRPYKGKAKIKGKKISEYKNASLYRKNLALLPQNPKTVFLKNTIFEDYVEILRAMDIPKSEHEEKIKLVAEKFGIEHLLDRHPYDLSGGEQQKCALVKLMLTEPEIILLDEPTKGLDSFSKAKFAELLKELQNSGKTILMVTHDVEFSASVSDKCALFFDGKIISEGTPNEFFSGNNFYTTAASRISREIFSNAVLCEEVVALCKAE